MSDTTPTWRCPVCEGVNHGGRVCTTCGEALPEGLTPKALSRRSTPRAAEPPTVVAPPRGPRTPSPEEIFGSNPFR